MGNKINRVQNARHVFASDATAAIAAADFTSGFGLTHQNSAMRIINATALQGNGSAHAGFTTGGTLTANTRSGIGAQVAIDVPDADSYCAEIWGFFVGSIPSGAYIAPVFGTMADLATAANENQTLLYPMCLENHASPAGFIGRAFHYVVEINQEPLAQFAFGFELLNGSGGNLTITPYQVRFGFRALDNNLRYYDPVR